MTMKKSLLAVFTLVIAVTLTSCGVSVEKFNDTLVNSQKTIVSDYEKVAVLMSKEGTDKAQLKLQEDSLIIKIDAQIAKVNELKAPKGGEEFKASAIETFQGYRKVIEVALKATSFTDSTTVDEYNTYVDELNKVTEEGSVAEDNFLTKQKEFATANGMKLVY